MWVPKRSLGTRLPDAGYQLLSFCDRLIKIHNRFHHDRQRR
ncbi:hypothetical protein Pan258_23150 [Symmachiella dynata]|nr:hypothetical protein Pan258_23150 [Symmachiella dynata]